MAIEWKLEKRLIKDLLKHSKNPRKLSEHDADHLKHSLQKFGLIDKPIINTDNTIIGGHQRIAMLKKMGVKEIEVYVPAVQLEAKDVDELNIRLNRNVGSFDDDILANEWDMDDLVCYGFKAEDLLGEDPEMPGIAQEDESEENCPTCGKKVKK